MIALIIRHYTLKHNGNGRVEQSRGGEAEERDGGGKDDVGGVISSITYGTVQHSTARCSFKSWITYKAYSDIWN